MNEIIKAFIQGKQIRLRTAKPQYHFRLADGKVIGLSDTPFDELVFNLMINPERFELYQEPKKAWIETKGLEDSLINMGAFNVRNFKLLDAEQGAIALAREFLKRYSECFIESNETAKERIGYRIIAELVGSENLKDLK